MLCLIVFFQLFSLHVTLMAKSRQHLQLLLQAGKNAPKGQICRVKRCHFSLRLYYRQEEGKAGEALGKEGIGRNSAGKKDIFCVV